MVEPISIVTAIVVIMLIIERIFTTIKESHCLIKIKTKESKSKVNDEIINTYI